MQKKTWLHFHGRVLGVYKPPPPLPRDNMNTQLRPTCACSYLLVNEFEVTFLEDY